jgi:hypothetical protein
MDAHCCSFTCTISHYDKSRQLCWCYMHTRWLEGETG